MLSKNKVNKLIARIMPRVAVQKCTVEYRTQERVKQIIMFFFVLEVIKKIHCALDDPVEAFYQF